MLLDSYVDAENAVGTATNEDGFVYPPLVKKVRAQAKIFDGAFLPENQWDWEDVPNTERPAHLHRLPPSHELRLEAYSFDSDLRKNDGGFLMYLAGYLFGYRLQFADWWFDGRIKMKSSHNVLVRDEKAEAFLSSSYATWKTWSPEARKHFTNILYMNSRSEVYEWDWERFMIAYMVFDACYKHAKSMGHVQKCLHQDRLKRMCDRYGLYFHEDLSGEIVSLRNNLFHEALWDGGQPCNSGGQNSFNLTEYLRGINNRLIPAMLGYSTEYIGTHWNSLSRCGF